MRSLLISNLSDDGLILAKFERGHHAATHTSQVALQLEATLPIDVAPASSKYRLVNDPTAHTQNRCLFIDTPGHGKLRSIAIDQLIQLENLNGIIAVVDAADLSEAGPEHGVEGGLRETSEYLYEILLMLQRRHAKNRSSRSAKPIAVLIAANKMDLFTALPTPLVKSSLERGIAEVRDSRARGLLDSGIKTHSMSDSRDDGDWLGELDEKFRFSHMSEAGISVDIVGGHVTGLDGADARGWWQWIAAQM